MKAKKQDDIVEVFEYPPYNYILGDLTNLYTEEEVLKVKKYIPRSKKIICDIIDDLNIVFFKINNTNTNNVLVDCIECKELKIPSGIVIMATADSITRPKVHDCHRFKAKLDFKLTYSFNSTYKDAAIILQYPDNPAPSNMFVTPIE